MGIEYRPENRRFPAVLADGQRGLDALFKPLEERVGDRGSIATTSTAVYVFGCFRLQATRLLLIPWVRTASPNAR